MEEEGEKMTFVVTVLCKECDGRLCLDSTGKMGSRHSNFYKCNKCGRVVEIYDDEIKVEVKK